MIRVAIADNERLRLQVLARVIDDSDDMSIVTAVAELEVLHQDPPEYTDVLVLDVSLVCGENIQKLAAIERTYPGTRILVMLDSVDGAEIAAFIAAGAGGFLCKSDPVDHLLSAIRRASLSSRRMTQDEGRTLAYRWNRDKDTHSGLTERERNVLCGVAQGQSNREISVTFGLSEKTVKNHVSTILSKLDVHTRTQAAVMAVTRGLVPQRSIQTQSAV